MADLRAHRGFLDQKAGPGAEGHSPRIEDDPLIELARIVSESAANLGRLGVQPGDEPTVLLNRATQRTTEPDQEPVTAPDLGAQTAPTAMQNRTVVASFERDLMAELRQTVEPVRPPPVPRAPIGARNFQPGPFDDEPTIALPLRGGGLGAAPAAAAAPAGPKAEAAVAPAMADAFDDLFSDAPQGGGAAAKPEAATAKPAAPEKPRLGDNFPRPAIEGLGMPGADRKRTMAPASAHPKAQRRPVQRPKGESNRGLLVAFSVLGAVVVGGLGFLGYRAYAPATDPILPPVIKADTKPAKVKADPQAATVVDTQPKLTADRVEGETKLVTKQEDPVDQVPTGIRKIVPGAPGTAAPLVDGEQPRQVKTVIVRPDGTVQQQVAPVAPPVPAPAPVAVKTTSIVVPPAAPEAPAAAAQPDAQPAVAARTTIPQGNAAQPVAKPPVAAPAPKAQGPVGAPLVLGQAPNGQVQPKLANVAPPPEPVAPAAPAVPVASSGGGDFMVQLSSQKSDADARRAFTQAQAKHAALAGKTLDIQQADLGARGTFFRVRVPGGSQEQANALCGQIKSSGGDCVVTRR